MNILFATANRVNENEIKTLAGGDPASYRIVDGFESLDDELQNLLGETICNQPEQQQSITVIIVQNYFYSTQTIDRS